ncbi:MAG TPA: VCBS repeat-containing protein [Verrucomicrobiae bacterium]|nr:VCBS repeat-containing protein [Verrucomicrobiae bacterium]
MGPEIFPIENQINQLRVADLDGDGLQDLVVVNNARSKITFLLNRTGKPEAKGKTVGVTPGLNDLPPGSRFHLDSISSEKRISALVVADLNGDGRPDLAYYGEPRELVVLYNEGTNGWSTPKRWPVTDGVLDANALVAGDINGDHRPDLLLLGEKQIHILTQTPEHKLAEPERLPYAGNVKGIQITDLNGDGREDLLLVNWEHANPLRFRLQNESGQLDPETHFSMPPIRSYWVDDLDGDHVAEVVTIAQQSGRALLSQFRSKPAELLSGTLRHGQFQILPLNRTEKNRRGVTWADLNKDGLPDLLVAEPDSGQISVYSQKPDGSLSAAKTFPSLTGVTELATADWDGDGLPEIFLLSQDERQIGVTHLDASGRLPFPKILPISGRPMVMAAGELRAKGQAVLAVLVDQEGRRELQIFTPDGRSSTQKLSESFKANPETMLIHDVNQDGANDLVVLIPYEKVKLLVQGEVGAFEEMDVAPPGGNSEQPWTARLDVDGDGKPELLLAQKNFVRAVVLQSDRKAGDDKAKATWSFSVKEQINGAASNSRITGATALPNGTNHVDSVFLLDAERKALTLCERDQSGVWQVIRNLPLPVSDFNRLQSVRLGGDKPNCVAFTGANSVAWMRFNGSVWELAELDGYETPVKDGYLNDLVSGDLNNDHRRELIFMETAKNYLDIVGYVAPHNLIPSQRWQVFEERTFRNRRGDGAEPREAVVADVTGDGKNDLIIVVHDRVLVYPQE